MPRYSEARKHEALKHLALTGGKLAQTSAETGINVNTLKTWRWKTHKAEYEKHAEEVGQQIEDGLVAELRERAAQASEVEGKLIEEIARQVEAGEFKGKDAAAAAQRLSIIKGVAIDKLMKLTERPDTIIERRTFIELVQGLKQKGVVVIEGEAEEIKEIEAANG